MGSKRRAVAERVRWLSRDQELAWRALGSLVHQLRLALECQLERDSDLSFIEYYALARLSEERDHRLRMSELAAATNGSLSRLSLLVKRHEGGGYVRREPDPTAGRVTIAVVTDCANPKGVAAAPAPVAAFPHLVIEEFGATELAQLRTMCERIAARV